MAINYTLNWSDDLAKPPFTLVGGTVDTTTTSLALTGKGFVNWGERVQENFLRLLENFAKATPPAYPTVGQLWYDTGNDLLMVYTTALVWVPVCEQCSGMWPTPAPTTTAPVTTTAAPTTTAPVTTAPTTTAPVTTAPTTTAPVTTAPVTTAPTTTEPPTTAPTTTEPPTTAPPTTTPAPTTTAPPTTAPPTTLANPFTVVWEETPGYFSGQANYPSAPAAFCQMRVYKNGSPDNDVGDSFSYNWSVTGISGGFITGEDVQLTPDGCTAYATKTAVNETATYNGTVNVTATYTGTDPGLAGYQASGSHAVTLQQDPELPPGDGGGE